MLLRPDVPLLLPDSMAILLNCFLAIGSFILALFLIDVNLFAPLTDMQMHYKIRKNVGNAVPGVPSGAMRKHCARKPTCFLACASRNAEDGVPYI